MNFGSFTAAWPADWIIIAGAMLLISLESFRAGTSRGTAAALSFVFALYLYTALQSAYILGDMFSKITVPHGQVIIFALFVAACYFCMGRINSAFDIGGGIVPALMCGLATVLLILCVWTQTPALSELWHLQAPLAQAFGDPFRFFWAFGALGLLAIARS